MRTDSAVPPWSPNRKPVRWGRLELRAKLGEGAYGEVYRAWDPSLELEVALKLLKGDGGSRLLLEGRALARVRHPNVVTVHGVDEHDGIGLYFTQPGYIMILRMEIGEIQFS